MDQWREFENWQEKCGGWMKDIEGRLRDVDLKPNLADKQAMLERLRVSLTEKFCYLRIVQAYVLTVLCIICSEL